MKTKECIVHIGMHKTGSTSIQATLQKVRIGNRYCYFDMNHPNHTERIVSLFSKERVCQAHLKKGWTQKEIEAYKEETRVLFAQNLRECTHQTMILSGEGIIGLTKEELIDFKAFLCESFEKITVVAYVRPPIAYMESYFQELIKGGTGHFVVERIYPGYRKLFEKFDQVFGKENVHLWKFDPARFPKEDVVLDFSQRIGIDIKANEVVHVNESLSAEALSLLYIYRKYGPGYGKGPTVIRENNRLISELKKIGTGKIGLAQDLAEKIIHHNEEDLRWIQERMGESLSENTSLNGRIFINSEEDLLQISNNSIEALKNLLKADIKTPEPSDFSEIASMVHLLRQQLEECFEIDNHTQKRIIKITELVKDLRRSGKIPNGNIQAKQIVNVLAAALEEISFRIEEAQNEKLLIPKLGLFSISEAQSQKKGALSRKSKRIAFQSSLSLKDGTKEENV